MEVRVMVLRPDDCAVPALAQEELLDAQNPLRHLMHVDVDIADDVIEDTSPSKDYLSVLPRQSHSIKDEILSLTFQGNGKDQSPILISLYMDASPGCGGVAWPAGQILSNYIVKRGLLISLQGKTILELGSGTGLVGLVAGKLGAKVWITDQAPLLDIMRRNVEMNHLESCVTVAELNWGADPPPDIPRPDIILAADCVYFEPAFPLLAQTLADLADQSTEVLFCYKKRRKADKRFFAFLKKYFTWEDVNDDPDRAIYNREAISLLRLHRTSRAR